MVLGVHRKKVYDVSRDPVLYPTSKIPTITTKCSRRTTILGKLAKIYVMMQIVEKLDAFRHKKRSPTSPYAISLNKQQTRKRNQIRHLINRLKLLIMSFFKPEKQLIINVPKDKWE